MEQTKLTVLDDVLYIAMSVGFNLLRCGAEIQRVEDTISRICASYDGVHGSHVFAIGSNITVTVYNIAGQSRTETWRVKGYSYDFDKICMLNSLSRRICVCTPSRAEVEAEIKKIKTSPVYPQYMRIFGYGIISASFAMFFGGNAPAGVVAFFVGILTCIIDILLRRIGGGVFTGIIVCSAVTALISFSVEMRVPYIDGTKIIIGVLMTLVPGIAITNSMRDFLAKDYLSGFLRLTEALVTATAIAVGVAAAIVIMQR